MAKESFPWNTIILLGALTLGGYFIYQYLKNSPLAKTVGGVIEGGGQVIDTGTSPGGLPKPIVKYLEQIPISIPEPIDLIEPVNLVPHIVKTLAVDTKGNINPWKAPILATAAVGLLTGAIKPKQTVLKAQPKTTIPIVTVNPVSRGVSILRPLEIVKTGQAIKAANKAFKLEPNASKQTYTIPISTTKTATITKSIGVPNKVTISKIMRS